MAKMWICPRCHKEWDDLSARRNMKLCECGAKLVEKKDEKYVLVFDGFEIEIDTFPFKIGRSYQRLNEYVSREHCEIFKNDGEIYIKDLDSTNGTFINGEKIDTAALKPGMKVKLANIEGVFEKK